MLKRFFGYKIILIAICFLFAVTEMVWASAYADWAGVWETNYGVLKFEYAKDGYTGCFGNEGKLKGKIVDSWGYIIRGTWTEHGETGNFELRMDKEMKSFAGWRNRADNEWKGTRDMVPEPVD